MGRPRKNPQVILDEIDRRIANSDLLSPEEKAEARAKAKAHVEELRKKRAVEDYFQAAVRDEERAFDPNERMVEFVPDLPSFTPCITINGTFSYYHGCAYKVPMSVYRSLIDIQFAANNHQREIKGERRKGDVLRQPRYTDLSPNHPSGRVTTTGNMRI